MSLVSYENQGRIREAATWYTRAARSGHVKGYNRVNVLSHQLVTDITRLTSSLPRRRSRRRSPDGSPAGRHPASAERTPARDGDAKPVTQSPSEARRRPGRAGELAWWVLGGGVSG
ncbi:hypothetical protein ABZ801_28715 [Actinomadura sp. NPDC047616]|uniref:hypothetical protein n=1 Tax=Actinomadura sp. NPDC047616 TaxID=3155914 RepID=UPI0033F6BDD8